MVKLSVIVPTYNRRQVLERTLPLLLAQDLPAEEYEIIVVVNGSTDGTDELLNSLRPTCTLKHLAAQRRGAGAARNVGIRAAVGELILFLDDDLLCAPELLRQHVTAHRGPEPHVVHGPIYVAPDSARTMIRHVTETFYETYYRPLDPAMELRYPARIDSSLLVLSSLVNSSMPRNALLQCEGFDEEILAAEDLELGLRLWKAGCVFRFLPSATAYEYYVKTSRQHLRGQAMAVAAGDLRASRKHPEYRACSSLASLAETHWSKRWLFRALAACPVSPVPLISFPLRFEKWMYPFAPLRIFGVRLLRLSERLTRLRSAAHAAGSWKALQSEFGRRCPALLYHHVGPLRPDTYPWLNVSARTFAWQIRWLALRGYTGILPSDWLRWLREGTGLPRKPIMITFDDGYADIAQYALPTLRRHGYGATVFVVTGRTGGSNTWDAPDGSGVMELMTSEQIQYWAGQGIEFGAHTQTHSDLAQASEASCAAEIAGSKSDLVSLLGAPVASFAYPYGNFNEAVCNQVRAEYDLAFSTVEGINFLRGDPHLLRRVYVGPRHSLLEFAINVCRGTRLRWTDDLRMKVALRTRLRKTWRLLVAGKRHAQNPPPHPDQSTVNHKAE